jgi:hypothetical protein
VECALEDEKDENCVYSEVLYHHAATFSAATTEDQNVLAYILLTTADGNCSWFLNRFSQIGPESVESGTGSNLMTGAAALTAKPVAGDLSRLGFANLFADSTVRSIDANEYASKKFEAIESAIKAHEIARRRRSCGS